MSNIIFLCGEPGSGKTTIGKYLVKHYLKDFYFLDKDTLYSSLTGEIMSILTNNQYDRDSPLYKNHCRNHEYNGLIDCAIENAKLFKNSLICSPFGKELSDENIFLDFKKQFKAIANTCFI